MQINGSNIVLAIVPLFYVVLCQTFTIEPKDATFAVGEVTSLRCAVSSTSIESCKLLFLQWIRYNNNKFACIPFQTAPSCVSNDTRYSILRNHNLFTLQIEDLNMEDNGHYYCEWYSLSSRIWFRSKVATLNIISKWPSVSCNKELQNATLSLSATKATFTCFVSSPSTLVLPITMVWMHQGIEFSAIKTVQPGENMSLEWTTQGFQRYENLICYAGRKFGHGTSCKSVLPGYSTVKTKAISMVRDTCVFFLFYIMPQLKKKKKDTKKNTICGKTDSQNKKRLLMKGNGALQPVSQ